jgi:CBS domain-containing protein
VVDADGRPIGLVMRSALAQRLDRKTAADVMIPVPFVLHETASLTDAAMLVAYQAIDHTPVVSAEGRMVGMLASSDVCRLVNGAPRESRMAR